MQKIAFILIGGGGLVALGFFFQWFFATSLISLGFRMAIAAVIVGILLLLTLEPGISVRLLWPG